MPSESIISAFVEAAGTILAAFVGAGYIGKMINKTAEAYFFSYSNKEHNLRNVLGRAQNSIIIIANCGDNLLREYSDNLRKYMKSGVSIKYVLIDYEHFPIMDSYTANGEDYAPLRDAVKELNKLKAEYPSKLDVRVFESILTASYIGVDLEKEPITNSWTKRSILQVMPYHYHVAPRYSPATFLTPKDTVHFGRIVDCVEEIWDNSKVIDNLDSIIPQAQGN